MASKKVNIQIDTRANTTGAKQAEAAMDSVTASTKRTEVASTQAAAASTKQAAGASRVGQVAQSAGFQVQDFAVQIAGGTSALTAMAQQAPQFLGVFGPGGAIAGALIAVGAIAVRVFQGMEDDSANAAEQATFLADSIEEIGKNAAKAVSKDIDFGLAQIDAAAEQARGLIGEFEGVTDAANAAALASLTNAEKIREAELEIRRLRGEQVDELEDIAAKTASEAAIREEQARQEIAAQQARLAAAQAEEAAAKQALDDKRSLQIQTGIELREEEKKLRILREQRDALAEQARERGKFSEGQIPFAKTPAAERAQAQLDDQAFQTLLNTTQQKVNELESQLAERGGALTEAVASASTALEGAMANTAVIAQEIAITIPEIEAAFQAESIKAQVEGVRDAATQAATEVQGVIDTVKPANAAEAAALEELKPMVADKKITADETLRVAQLLATLDGAIRTQMGTAAANTDKLIQTISTMQKRLDDQQRVINQLQSSARGSGN